MEQQKRQGAKVMMPDKGKVERPFRYIRRISTSLAASGISMISIPSCIAGSTRWPRAVNGRDDEVLDLARTKRWR
jgi:hypothetical protein